MAFYCQNLPLGALSRNAPSVLVGELFKKFGIFLNTGVRLTVEECMEVNWKGILTAAGEMGVDQSMRNFPLFRCVFFYCGLA